MKITSIDVFLVTIGQPSVPGSPWNPVVVRINTEDGISGYGEVGLAYGDTKESAVGMCRLCQADHRHGRHEQRGHLGPPA